mgnify:CR=1 FL=1
MLNELKRGIITKQSTFSCASGTNIELTMEQSGTTIFLDGSGTDAITFKLPKVADNAGANFRFIMTNDPHSDFSLTFNQNEDSGTNLIKLNTPGASATYNLSGSSALVISEYFEAICDGNNWYILLQHKTTGSEF